VLGKEQIITARPMESFYLGSMYAACNSFEILQKTDEDGTREV